MGVLEGMLLCGGLWSCFLRLVDLGFANESKKYCGCSSRSCKLYFLRPVLPRIVSATIGLDLGSRKWRRAKIFPLTRPNFQRT